MGGRGHRYLKSAQFSQEGVWERLLLVSCTKAFFVKLLRVKEWSRFKCQLWFFSFSCWKGDSENQFCSMLCSSNPIFASEEPDRITSLTFNHELLLLGIALSTFSYSEKVTSFLKSRGTYLVDGRYGYEFYWVVYLFRAPLELRWSVAVNFCLISIDKSNLHKVMFMIQSKQTFMAHFFQDCPGGGGGAILTC